MRKTLTLFALLMLAFVCPAAAQQIVIDEITIQGAESYTVNEEMVVRFKVNNNSGVPLAADDYSLSVNVGGVYAGKPAATKDIAKGTYESFMARVAPHKAGANLPVEIVFKGMGTVKATADQKVTVGEEIFAASKTIGEPNSCETQRVVYPYYNYSQSETVYTADMLKLSAGAKITNLTFKGYKESSHSIPLKVWVELTDDTAPVSSGTNFINTESMMVALDGSYNLPQAGEGYANYEEHGEILSVNLSTPIEYVAGKSLRVVVEASKGITYKTCYVECDKNIVGQSVLRYSDYSTKDGYSGSSVTVENKAFESKTLPVLYLGVDQEAPVLSGKVLIAQGSEVNPLSDATVVLTNGNIMYLGDTDASGNYSITVKKPDLKYDVTVETEEYTIFPFTETVEMNGASATKNLLVTEASGAYILSAEFPETGVENTPVTVKANIANYDGFELDETNAKIILKFDGEQVAEVEGEDLYIDAYDNDNFTLTFTPHASGEKELTVEVYVNNVLQHSKSGNITISKELASKEFTMDAGEMPSYVANTPIRLYSEHSYSQTLLTSDLLSGLAAGSKVTGLKLQSASGKDKGFNIDLKVWIMNTEDGVDNVKIDPYSANLKQVYTGTLKQRQHGKVGDTPTEFENFIDIIFDEPFVYEGKNIRIAMQADNAGGYQQTYFKALREVTTSYQKSSDIAGEIKDRDWASTAEKTPIFTFVVDNASIVTGTVVDKDSKTPVADAEVKLTAADADIIYTATTDAEGKFNVSVIQANHSFKVSASADGYKTAENVATVSANFASPLNLGTIELEQATEATITINPTIGYATFYDSKHAVKIPEDVTPYVFGLNISEEKGYEMGLIAYADYLEGIDETYNNVIPAGEAVVLEGAGDVTLEYTTSALSLCDNNWLFGFDTEKTTTLHEYWTEMEYTDEESYFYALSLNAEKDPSSVGFYWVNDNGTPFKSAAHKAYLSIPSAAFSWFASGEVQVKGIPFNKGADAIKNVNTSASSETPMFNLAGQRVNKYAKGIVIKNGKKMLGK